MQITSQEIFFRKHLTSRKALQSANFSNQEIFPFQNFFFLPEVFGKLRLVSAISVRNFYACWRFDFSENFCKVFFWKCYSFMLP